MRILELLMRETLPQRNFFRASEVSDLLKIKPHEMRYWESEFPQLRPQKTKNGQRIYRRQDLIIFSAIKHLLLEKKLSLAGAQRIIAESDDLFAHPPQKAENIISANDGHITADEDVVDAQPVMEDKFPGDNFLQEAAYLLDEEDDEETKITQQIYENFGEELSVASAKESVKVISTRRDPIARHAYERTLATLKESKASLTEILGMLDKYHESNFWHGFKG